MRSVFLAAALLGPASVAAAQVPDFTGVDQFWRVAEMLQNRVEPSAMEWDALFSTPGYAALEQRERRRAALQLGMRAALNPLLAGERDSLLASNSWTARVVRHIQDVSARRDELEAFRRRLVDDDFLTKAIARAQTLLPDGTTERAGAPPVAFIFFLPDGRGYPDLIVADLANLCGRPDIVPFFSHEVTHFYYAHLARERGRQPETPFDKVKLALLTKLFEESLGDQHDKAPYLDLSDTEFMRAPLQEGRRNYLRDYRAHSATASALVPGFKAALASQEPDQIEAFSRNLALEGRPLGFHMTRLIRQRLGDNRLKSHVGDPLGWYAAFLEASAAQSVALHRATEGYVAMADGVRIRYRAIGERGTPVFIPVSVLMSPYLDALSKDHRLVYYDPRGRGGSDTGAFASLGLTRNIEDLETLRRHFGFEQIAIIGLSGFALEAAAYALAHPARVSRLVQLAPVPPRQNPHMAERAAGMPKRINAAVMKQHDVERSAGADPTRLCQLFYDAMGPAWSARPERIDVAAICRFPNEHPDHQGKVWNAFAPSVETLDLRPRLGELRMPRLVIYGERDLMPLAGVKEWIVAGSQVELLIVPGADHVPHIDRPDIVLPAIAKFLCGALSATAGGQYGCE